MLSWRGVAGMKHIPSGTDMIATKGQGVLMPTCNYIATR